MKKKLAVLLTVVCLFTIVLPGCNTGGGEAPSGPEIAVASEGQPKEIPTINILLDFCRSRPRSSAVSDLLYSIPGYGTEFIALTESSPYDFQERDAYMTRVKTEIMAGKGPDIFLCENPYTEEMGQGLFPFPQKAMKNHLLLPLDGYIENAEFMELDRLLPIVMETGRNEEGQQILPVGFNFSVVAYNRELFTLEEELPVTWDEAIASDDPMVRYAAMYGDCRDIFGEVADLEKDTMSITEEDIALRFRQARELQDEEDEGVFPDFTEWNEEFKVYRMIGDTSRIACIELGSHWLDNEFNLGGETEYWLAPKYNTEGGITANVETFAAINRNTEHPKESFRVLDKLMSYEGQKSGLMGELFCMPVHMDVGLDGSPGADWTMNEWNAGQYRSLIEQINAVRYTTPVEQEFWNIYPDNFNNGGEWEDIVHEHYMKMQMMLAES